MLLVINLSNRQRKLPEEIKKVSIDPLIFSEKDAEKSFNICDDMRKEVLRALYKEGAYESERRQTILGGRHGRVARARRK